MALRPDPVADHVIATTVAGDPAAVAGWLSDLGRTEADARAALANLARAVGTFPEHRGVAADALAWGLGARGELWAPAVEVGAVQPHPLVGAMVAALGSAADPPVDVAELAEALPREHPVLSPVRAAALTRLRSQLPRGARADADQTETEAIAALDVELAIEQSRAGDRAGALDAINQAVTLPRALAEAHPAVTPTLAGPFHHLAAVRAETGDRAGALDAINEAVTLYRGLAEANPAFTPNLAGSLNNLANRRAETGDRAGALDAFESARLVVAAEPGAEAIVLAARTRFVLAHLTVDAAGGSLVEAVASVADGPVTPTVARARAELREAYTDLADRDRTVA
ncbi:MAG: hypothetical protein ACK5PP_11310, partial [Acidimicrobiales bacterium]